MEQTKQINFWQGDFGREYTDRNTFDPIAWDNYYLQMYGKTKPQLNEEFIGHLPKDARILEIGCNIGLQLRGLQQQGFTNLYGIEIQWYAVEKSKNLLQHVNIVQGSAFDLPFKDDYFDLVCTHGVLIHISPTDLPRVFAEMNRVSKQYIMGMEYYASQLTNINYRGNTDYLWKADYCQLMQQQYPNLHLQKQVMLPYLSETEKGNTDYMYLLEKS